MLCSSLIWSCQSYFGGFPVSVGFLEAEVWFTAIQCSKLQTHIKQMQANRPSEGELIHHCNTIQWWDFMVLLFPLEYQIGKPSNWKAWRRLSSMKAAIKCYAPTSVLMTWDFVVPRPWASGSCYPGLVPGWPVSSSSRHLTLRQKPLSSRCFRVSMSLWFIFPVCVQQLLGAVQMLSLLSVLQMPHILAIWGLLCSTSTMVLNGAVCSDCLNLATINAKIGKYIPTVVPTFQSNLHRNRE